jgi:hypothetical protein
MISDLAYQAGGQAAWASFVKESAPALTQIPKLRPLGQGMHNAGGGVNPMTNTGVLPGGAKTQVTPGGGATQVGAPAAISNMNTQIKPKPAAPAAPAPGAAPAAPAPAAPPPAPGAAPGAPPAPGFMQSLKEQAPGALLNTGLMMGVPMMMNALSGPGNQPQ